MARYRKAPAQMRRFRYLLFGAIVLEVGTLLFLTSALRPL